MDAAGPPRPLTAPEAGRPGLDPTVPFVAHSSAGEPIRIRSDDGDDVAAFPIDHATLADPARVADQVLKDLFWIVEHRSPTAATCRTCSVCTPSGSTWWSTGCRGPATGRCARDGG
jgi:hypothetical protein